MRNKIYQRLAGLSLLVLIGIPTFVPCLHELLHYHQHLHCTATTSDIHLHADVYGCKLCDYLTTFTFLCDATTTIVADEVLCITLFFSWDSPYVTAHPGTCSLRGPPIEFV
jgi:hypothetical protein